jgi:rod shape-determining protein MreC
MSADPKRVRTTVGLLVLTAIAIATLDSRGDAQRSPIDPLRSAVAGVLGPLEDGTATVMRPITDIPGHFADVDDLRRRNDELEAANDDLARQLNSAEANQHRSSEITGISELADTSGFDVVPAQVVAIGAAQSFSRTVTIDKGSNDGVSADLTVINADGLVGRVIEVTPSTSTVLLIIDAKSTIGGRLAESMELGFLDGDGDVSGDGTLELSLVDHTISPRQGDRVVTWGSRHDAPYVPGVPVGWVDSVRSSPAELTETAEIKPFVDFSSLDVVAVVTKAAPDDHRDLADEGSR